MPKERNDSSDQALTDLSDRVLSHWFWMMKKSNVGAGRKTGQWRKHERGETQLNKDVIKPGTGEMDALVNC